MNVICPFCSENQDDLLALEHHLENYICLVFGTLNRPAPGEIPTLQELREILNNPTQTSNQ